MVSVEKNFKGISFNRGNKKFIGMLGFTAKIEIPVKIVNDCQVFKI